MTAVHARQVATSGFHLTVVKIVLLVIFLLILYVFWYYFVRLWIFFNIVRGRREGLFVDYLKIFDACMADRYSEDHHFFFQTQQFINK